MLRKKGKCREGWTSTTSSRRLNVRASTTYRNHLSPSMKFARRIPRLLRTGGFWFLILVLGSTASIAWLMMDASLTTQIRDIAVVSGGILGLSLAGWRSLVAERQAETARMSLLYDRYQRSVGLLDSDNVYVRVGEIHALHDLAEENLRLFGPRVSMLMSEIVVVEEARGAIEKDSSEYTPSFQYIDTSTLWTGEHQGSDSFPVRHPRGH